MDYYESNMNVLKKERIELYDDVVAYQEVMEEVKDCENALILETSSSKDGNPILLCKKKGHLYRLNSGYRPLQETKAWANQFEYNNLNLVVSMFGFGNGYFVRELKKKLKEGDYLLVLEPKEEIFIYVLHHYDLKDIIGEPSITILIGEKGLKGYYNSLARILHWSNMNSFIECEHPQYKELFPEAFTELRKMILENKEREMANRNTEEEFSIDIVDNLTKNLMYIPNSNCCDEFKGLLDKEVPVIIVSAGPSLDGNIKELKNAKGKSIILATDTAMRYLYKHGIEPDVTITIDPRKPDSYFDNTGFETIPLICCSSSSHYAMSKHQGRKIWFCCHPYFIDLYRRAGFILSQVGSGGSVATSAFVFAVNYFAARNIILIGQDLAYQGEYTHAGHEVSTITAEELVYYVDGIDGKPVKTRFDWQFYLKWFERTIKLLDEKAYNIIDATEGGAMIHGTNVMPLKEAIEKYCNKEVDLKDMLNHMEPTFRLERLHQMLGFLEGDYKDLSLIVKKAKESIEYCDKIIHEYKRKREITESILKKVNRVSKNNNQILKKRIYILVEEIMKMKNIQILQTLNDMTEDEYLNTIKTYEKQKQMMMDLKESSEELMPFMKDSVDNLIKNI